MAGTVLQLGYSDPLSDSFGAHPLLGSVLDLNDGVTFTLISPDGVQAPAPPRTLALAGNIRSQGEIATRAITRHNRVVTARLLVGPTATSAALLASIRTLLGWLAAPPAIPITLKYQPFNASTPLYLDVVGASHNLPSDEGQWLRGQFEPLTLSFICRPGMRGSRITLQNLVPNAGFEQPNKSGAPFFVPVFSDPLTSASAYTFVVGSGGVGSSVLSINAGGRVIFGSPAWSALALWQARWRWVTSLQAMFYLHYADFNNSVYVQVASSGASVSLIHRVAGVNTTIATATIALTNAAFYWLQCTQYPGAPGNPPYLAVTLFADSGGAIGATLATLTGPAASDTVALSGPMALEAAGANLQVGGAFANVHTVSLFGPGGWACASAFGSAVVSGAWEGNGTNSNPGGNGQPPANTCPNGPVASFGALRLDAPPAGAWDASWTVYRGGGGTPTWTTPGSWAIPCGPNQTLRGGVWIRSSGLAASASIQMDVHEYDASGTELRAGTLAGTNGNIPAWTQITGSYTTGANCAYVSVVCRGHDSTAASANGILWFDNAQLWNQTATGMATMPWCDLRAVVSPATLVVSGLQGDLPAPAHLALGSYIASTTGGGGSLPSGGALSLYLGRKGTTSPKALLVNGSQGAYGAAFSPQAIAAADGGSYGGMYTQATVGGGGFNPRFFSGTAADAAGSYHLLARVKSDQSSPAIQQVKLRVVSVQQTDPWVGLLSGTDLAGQWAGGWSTPLTTPGAWAVVDAGPCTLPPFPGGALSDPSKLFLIPRTQWQDGSGGSATGYTNWQALLPVDGSLLVATINNPANSFGAVTNQWVYAYADGLLVNRAGASDGPSWSYSLEGKPQPNPAGAAGGAGTQNSGAVNVNSGADPYLLLDPGQSGLGGAASQPGVGGVNQMVAVVADASTTASVLPCFAEVSYAPLYLEPR